MNRCLPYLFLFALLSVPVLAQFPDGHPYYVKPDSVRSQSVTPDKIHFDTKMGTSIGSRYNRGAYLGTVVSPYISYRISPYWSFQTSATIINGHTGRIHSGYGDDLALTFAIPQQSIFAQGHYQPSAWLQRIDLFYELSRFNNSLNGNPQNMSFQSKEASKYDQYKIRENRSCIDKVASCVGWTITNLHPSSYIESSRWTY